MADDPDLLLLLGLQKRKSRSKKRQSRIPVAVAVAAALACFLGFRFVLTVLFLGGAVASGCVGLHFLQRFSVIDYVKVLESFVVPDDRKVIVSVHAYLPREFVSDKKGKVSWSKHDEDSVEDILEFRENIQTLFLDKNIPVAVTEYGCVGKKHSSKRESWAKYYVKAFSDPDIPLFWWDNGEEYCVIARKDGKVTDKDLVKIITKRTYSRG